MEGNAILTQLSNIYSRISKLTDCDGEANETDSSLDYAKDCGYITVEAHQELVSLNDEVRRMLGAMLKNPSPFLLKCE